MRSKKKKKPTTLPDSSSSRLCFKAPLDPCMIRVWLRPHIIFEIPKHMGSPYKFYKPPSLPWLTGPRKPLPYRIRRWAIRLWHKPPTLDTERGGGIGANAPPSSHSKVGKGHGQEGGDVRMVNEVPMPKSNLQWRGDFKLPNSKLVAAVRSGSDRPGLVA